MTASNARVEECKKIVEVVQNLRSQLSLKAFVNLKTENDDAKAMVDGYALIAKYEAEIADHLADARKLVPPADAQPATEEAWRVFSARDSGYRWIWDGKALWVSHRDGAWRHSIYRNVYELQHEKAYASELTGPAAQPYIDSLRKQIGEGTK